MFGSSINCVFFLLILLISISTNVFSYCDDGQTCFGPYSSDIPWCCSYDETCGSSYESCISDSNLSPAVTAIIIVGSIFFFVICLTCCIHSQQRQRRLPATYANSNTRVGANPYQQQILRGPVRVVHVRPVYHVGSTPPVQSYPSIYEAPPPSYETATASFPSVHQSSAPPSVTTTVHH